MTSTSDPRLSILAVQYLNALLRKDRHTASRIILEATERDIPVKDIYLHVFQPVQYEIGRLWQLNRISVADEHYCTAATQLIMSQLYPLIFSSRKKGRSLIATCVNSELHEIGIRMVADFFELDGWDTYYFGANTPTESIIQAIIQHKASLLAVSATITFNVDKVRELIEAVRAEELCRQVKIILGGHPFNADAELWQKVGADGCAADARQAVLLGNELYEYT